MPTFAGTPTPVTANLKKLAAVYGAALVGVFVVVLLLRAKVISPVFALLPLGSSVFFAIRQPRALEALEKATAQGAAAWKSLEARWHQVKDNRTFLEKRREADQVAQQLQSLSGEENRQITELKTRQREAQLTAFLQRFFIDDPRTKIKGVGSGRAITLRSYGIETAADVDPARFPKIDGFGPVITGAIVAWRRS
jgi:DNA-binding helix-hairpin-helix protein with protein kinase domain